MASREDSDLLAAAEEITSYADGMVSTINPAIVRDRGNAEDAPLPKTKPHVCNKSYTDIDMDLIDLITTYQRHILDA